MIVHVCNLSICNTEAGGGQFQGLLGLHTEFKATLCYMADPALNLKSTSSSAKQNLQMPPEAPASEGVQKLFLLLFPHAPRHLISWHSCLPKPNSQSMLNVLKLGSSKHSSKVDHELSPHLKYKSDHDPLLKLNNNFSVLEIPPTIMLRSKIY